MRITAITRFKHGDLYNALKEAGWTQLELGRKAGVCASTVGIIINMKWRPTEEIANKIQAAFGRAGIVLDVLELWPESFAGIKKSIIIEETRDIEPVQLEGAIKQTPMQLMDLDITKEILHDVLQQLTNRERKVLTMRFFEGLTMAEVGKRLKRSGSLIGRIEAKALRKLRHPARLRALDPAAGMFFDGRGNV